MQSSVKRRRLANLDKLSLPRGGGDLDETGHSSRSDGIKFRQRCLSNARLRPQEADSHKQQGWGHQAASVLAPSQLVTGVRGSGSVIKEVSPQQQINRYQCQSIDVKGPKQQTDDLQHKIYHPLISARIPAAAVTGLEFTNDSKKVGDKYPEMLLGLLATSSRKLNGWDIIQAKVSDKMVMLDNPAKNSNMAQGSRTCGKDEERTADAAKRLRNRVQIRSEGYCLALLTATQQCGSQAILNNVHKLTQDAATQFHQLWRNQVSQVMLQHGKDAADKFVQNSGFLGSKLQVMRARQASMVGHTGIVIQETSSTFHVLNLTSGHLKVLAKPAGATIGHDEVLVMECRVPCNRVLL